MKLKAIFFDVNETLLNLEKLKKSVDSILDTEGASEVWFSSLLHYSLVESIRGEYHDFTEIAAAVLRMQAARLSKDLSEDQIKDALSVVRKLDPYPDVIPALKELKKEIKLVAFSNGKPEVLQEQLENAEIANFFDQVFSVESCKLYKPHPESYQLVLKKLDLSPGEAMMVAAHGWDIAGAQTAGLKTAFVNRPGKSPFPLAPEPDHQLDNLVELIQILKPRS
ncbi:haloacid dehalogenase type II [Gramella sp. BOM4]|nr:haloacid dehalogenase type II [Christiangramia bathymodioli]